MKLFLAAVLMMVVIVSCRDIKEPVFSNIENVKLDKLTLINPSITLDVRYFNPNKFTAKLKQAEGDTWLDSSYLGHFIVDTTIIAPANSEFVVPVKLAVDMQYVLQNSFSLFSKQEVTVKITGKVRAGKGSFYKNFPIQYEARQNVSEIFR